MGSWVKTSTPAPAFPSQTASADKKTKMDAIRKKMQSLKAETEQLYATIASFEEATREASARADQADCDIRDLGKKVQNLEMGYDETNDKQYKEVESDVAALTRRIMLMEEEDKKSADNLCNTVTKLAVTSKNADQILKAVKVVENTCLNNEVTIEELDKNLRSTIKMAVDNEQKLDELSRKLGVQEGELKRGLERAELAEKSLKGIEEELETVGENMKQLEKSAEKALEREEKLVEKILSLQNKFKITEARFEYGEMNIKKCSDELNDTFDDMLANY